jgi:hypothetical protein
MTLRSSGVIGVPFVETFRVSAEPDIDAMMSPYNYMNRQSRCAMSLHQFQQLGRSVGAEPYVMLASNLHKAYKKTKPP